MDQAIVLRKHEKRRFSLQNKTFNSNGKKKWKMKKLEKEKNNNVEK